MDATPTINDDNRHQRLQQETLQIMDQLAAASSAAELPQPPPTLQACREKLAQNQYRVLVVGEMKRGKSSLINALIGRRLLPTDVDVATCQVFHITAADQEAFRLRFENDSVHPIESTDLSRFGSEAGASDDTEIGNEQAIRWIECEVPCRFLPPNMSIMDTPGVGSLYESHALITERFAPHADAVVFVVDVLEPLKKQEVALLEHILEITNNVFFVMTKIDLVDRTAWQAARDRHKQILQERFGEQLGEIEVWPVSSENMIKAAGGDDGDAELYLRASCYSALEQALQSFLRRVASAPRAQLALAVSARVQRSCRKALAGRLSVATQQSKQQLDDTRRAAAERLRQFQSEWGPQGTKAGQVVEEIRHCCSVGKQAFRDAFLPSGDLESHLSVLIDQLNERCEIEALCESLNQVVSAQVGKQWRHTTENVRERCVEVVRPLYEALDTALLEVDEQTPDIDVRLLANPDYKGGLRAHAGAIFATDEYRTGTTCAGASGLAALINPFLAVLPAVSLLGGILTGAPKTLEIVRQRNRAELKRCSQNQLRQLQRIYFDADLTNNRHSLVDEYFASLTKNATQAVKAVAEKKLAEMNDELERVKAQATMDQEQRKQEAERIAEHLRQFDLLGRKIIGLVNLGRSLDRPDSSINPTTNQQVAVAHRSAATDSDHVVEVS